MAGNRGMTGSAIVRLLQTEGYTNLLLKSRSELDLCSQQAVNAFFKQEKPDYVFLAAAKVGGIQANIRQPAEFLYENLMIQNNVIHAAYMNGVTKLCFLGTSCIFPKNTQQPMKEDQLLSGYLEDTNEAYALAKIAGLKLVSYLRREYGFNGVSIMPCNLYGTNDHFDLQQSHVLSALIRKFVDAVDNNDENVTVWGSGKARREFMHVDDCARAAIFVMEHYDGEQFINVGWGTDVSIKELAEIIGKKTGFHGNIIFDISRPDGMMQKCLDVTRMRNIGFTPRIDLDEGIARTIMEYRALKAAGKIDR